MMYRPKSPRGFTLIEIIIALGITVVLIFTVGATARALTASVERQKAMAQEQERWNRCVEIFTRDVRGWLPQSSGTGNTNSQSATGSGTAAAGTGSTANASSGQDGTLIQIPTTADSLSGQVWNGTHNLSLRSCTMVMYRLRKAGDQYQFTRDEQSSTNASNTSAPNEITLWTSSEPLKLEYGAANGWVSSWTGKTPPPTLRLTAGTHVAVVAVPLSN